MRNRILLSLVALLLLVPEALAEGESADAEHPLFTADRLPAGFVGQNTDSRRGGTKSGERFIAKIPGMRSTVMVDVVLDDLSSDQLRRQMAKEYLAKLPAGLAKDGYHVTAESLSPAEPHAPAAPVVFDLTLENAERQKVWCHGKCFYERTGIVAFALSDDAEQFAVMKSWSESVKPVLPAPGPQQEVFQARRLPEGYAFTRKDSWWKGMRVGETISLTKKGTISTVDVQMLYQELKSDDTRRGYIQGHLGGLEKSFAKLQYRVVDKVSADLEQATFEQPFVVDFALENDLLPKLWKHEEFIFGDVTFAVSVTATDAAELATLTEWVKSIKMGKITRQ